MAHFSQNPFGEVPSRGFQSAKMKSAVNTNLYSLDFALMPLCYKCKHHVQLCSTALLNVVVFIPVVVWEKKDFKLSYSYIKVKH